MLGFYIHTCRCLYAVVYYVHVRFVYTCTYSTSSNPVDFVFTGSPSACHRPLHISQINLCTYILCCGDLLCAFMCMRHLRSPLYVPTSIKLAFVFENGIQKWNSCLGRFCHNLLGTTKCRHWPSFQSNKYAHVGLPPGASHGLLPNRAPMQTHVFTGLTNLFNHSCIANSQLSPALN
jgi:hypothetical protein